MAVHDEVTVRAHRVHADGVSRWLRVKVRHDLSDKLCHWTHVGVRQASIELAGIRDRSSSRVFRQLQRFSVETGEAIKRSVRQLEKKPAAAVLDGLALSANGIPKQDLAKHLDFGHSIDIR